MHCRPPALTGLQKSGQKIAWFIRTYCKYSRSVLIIQGSSFLSRDICPVTVFWNVADKDEFQSVPENRRVYDKD